MRVTLALLAFEALLWLLPSSHASSSTTNCSTWYERARHDTTDGRPGVWRSVKARKGFALRRRGGPTGSPSPWPLIAAPPSDQTSRRSDTTLLWTALRVGE